MTRRLATLAVLAIFGTGCLVLALGTIALSDLSTWMPHVRTPLGQTGGILTDGAFTYIASERTGRVYKYSGDGTCVGWKSMGKRPISVAASDGRMVVSQGGQRSAIDDSAFVGPYVSGAAGTVVRSILGHPYLAGVDGSRRSLQPWYLTIVQEPWPGFIWWPVMICTLFPLARAYNGRRAARAAGCPPP